MSKLNLEQARQLLSEARDSFPHDACATCECFLGYVAQVQVDTQPQSAEVFASFKVARGEVHACLGCDPCPPGGLYAEYIKRKHSPPLITL